MKARANRLSRNPTGSRSARNESDIKREEIDMEIVKLEDTSTKTARYKILSTSR